MTSDCSQVFNRVTAARLERIEKTLNIDVDDVLDEVFAEGLSRDKKKLNSKEFKDKCNKIFSDDMSDHYAAGDEFFDGAGEYDS